MSVDLIVRPTVRKTDYNTIPSFTNSRGLVLSAILGLNITAPLVQLILRMQLLSSYIAFIGKGFISQFSSSANHP